MNAPKIITGTTQPTYNTRMRSSITPLQLSIGKANLRLEIIFDI